MKSTSLKASAVAALSLSAMLLVQCGPGEQRFREIEYDAQFEPRGRSELQAPEEREGSFYLIRYQRDGKVREISSWYGDKATYSARIHGHRMVIERTGNIELRRYLDADGKPLGAMHNGVFIERIERTPAEIKTTHLNAAEQPTSDSMGIGGYTITLSADGEDALLRYRAFDREGKSRPMAEGVFEQRDRYNKQGWRTESAFFDEQGKPVESEENIHRMTWSQDARGNDVEIRSFSKTGALRGSSYCGPITRRKFDERDLMTEERCNDIEDKPLEITGAIRRFVYDAAGRMIERKIFDEKDQPLTRWAANIKYVYDDRGNVRESHSFDASGKPLGEATRGVAIYRMRHDAYGRIIETRYLNAEEKPVSDSFSGAAIERYEFDDRGEVKRFQLLNAEEKLTNHSLYPYAEIEVTRTEDGKYRVVFYDKDRKQVREVIR